MQGDNTPRPAGLASLFPRTRNSLPCRLTNAMPVQVATRGTP